MPALSTPVCEFGWKAQNFSLQSTRNEIIELNKARGQNGTLIMFICNHCPYVCLLYTSPSPRDYAASRMPSSA